MKIAIHAEKSRRSDYLKRQVYNRLTKGRGVAAFVLDALMAITLVLFIAVGCMADSMDLALWIKLMFGSTLALMAVGWLRTILGEERGR